MPARNGDLFAKTAYRILVVEKAKPVRDVARALGMTYATLHARLLGRVPFRPDEINRLLQEVPDVRLADRLLSDTEFMAMPRPPFTPSTPQDVTSDLALKAASSVADALRDVDSAVDDRLSDPALSERIEARIVDAERALERLRFRIRTRSGPEPR